MENLINPKFVSWHVDLLNAYIHLDDVKIIKGLAISQNCRPDSSGWLFIETGKYTVKSRYKIESLYPDKEQCTVSYGPDTKTLLAFSFGN